MPQIRFLPVAARIPRSEFKAATEPCVVANGHARIRLGSLLEES